MLTYLHNLFFIYLKCFKRTVFIVYLIWVNRFIMKAFLPKSYFICLLQSAFFLKIVSNIFYGELPWLQQFSNVIMLFHLSSLPETKLDEDLEREVRAPYLTLSYLSFTSKICHFAVLQYEQKTLILNIWIILLTSRNIWHCLGINMQNPGS